MRMSGILDGEVLFFRQTFKQEVDFTPNPTAPFKIEFIRFAKSQQWSELKKRKARAADKAICAN